MSSVPVVFDDGSKALVPPERLSDALKDGGKVAQAMQFNDGSKGYVTLDRVHDAIHDGGQIIGTPPQPPKANVQPVPESFLERRAATFREGMVEDTALPALHAGQRIANEVYDVSAPNIAEQVYKQIRGMPNTLKQLPPKMVLAFMAAGGLGEAEGAELAKGAEESTPARPSIERLPEPSSPLDRLRNQQLPPAQPDYTPQRPSIERILPQQAAPGPPQPMATGPLGEIIPRVSPESTPSPAAEPVDPLLQKLRKIAADIQQKDAEAAAKKAARRGRNKAPMEPAVPTSDADMMRLLKLSLEKADAEQ